MPRGTLSPAIFGDWMSLSIEKNMSSAMLAKSADEVPTKETDEKLF
jgi:hypothetical protein